MKRKYSYFDVKKQTEREYSYIPFRYILAVLIILFEVLAVICIVVSVAWAVIYNVAGTRLLNKCDVY